MVVIVFLCDKCNEKIQITNWRKQSFDFMKEKPDPRSIGWQR